MSDSVKNHYNKANKTEEVIDDFYKNPIRKSKINQFSIFNARFTLNNVSLRIIIRFIKISLKKLHKLIHFRLNIAILSLMTIVVYIYNLSRQNRFSGN
ncbi:hypothetical protein GLOIN_2v1773332 [Rhizophagus irregularis DAOM 181602=DAOM 197198]|nr:hypothetical protein GLOIN_2v1773332 [Rhizophagus irregularis DAOM 181602=DAOM 197198]